MQQRNSSPWATILMGIPLASLPLMAIFGIPNLTPLAAGTNDLNSFFQSPPTDAQQRNDPFNSTGNSTGQHNADAFGTYGQTGNAAPYNSASTPGAPAWPANQTQMQEIPVAPGSPASTTSQVKVPWQQSGQPQQTSQAPQAYGGSGNSNGTIQPVGYERHVPSDSTGIPSASSLTWPVAIAQLQQMGISNYRLQAGITPDQFLFVCFYTPPDNPRLTIRYEAEASEPLVAVANVLSQIRDAQY